MRDRPVEERPPTEKIAPESEITSDKKITDDERNLPLDRRITEENPLDRKISDEPRIESREIPKIDEIIEPTRDEAPKTRY